MIPRMLPASRNIILFLRYYLVPGTLSYAQDVTWFLGCYLGLYLAPGMFTWCYIEGAACIFP